MLYVASALLAFVSAAGFEVAGEEYHPSRQRFARRLAGAFLALALICAWSA